MPSKNRQGFWHHFKDALQWSRFTHNSCHIVKLIVHRLLNLHHLRVICVSSCHVNFHCLHPFLHPCASDYFMSVFAFIQILLLPLVFIVFLFFTATLSFLVPILLLVMVLVQVSHSRLHSLQIPCRRRGHTESAYLKCIVDQSAACLMDYMRPISALSEKVILCNLDAHPLRQVD